MRVNPRWHIFSDEENDKYEARTLIEVCVFARSSLVPPMSSECHLECIQTDEHWVESLTDFQFHHLHKFQ